MPAPLAILTIISYEYENRQRLQFTTEFAKTNKQQQQQQHEKISTVLFYKVCARHCQSTAEYGRRLCLFCRSNKLTFDLLTLKVVSESRVTGATSLPILVFLGLSVLELGHIIIIIIIIPMTMFIVLTAVIMTTGHCESSLGSLDECRAAPSSRRPLDQAT